MNERRFPVDCPSCGHALQAQRFACPRCSTTVEGAFALPLLGRLSPTDQEFAVNLIKASGSLKELARQYGVSYPTVRNRLNDLIQRIEEFENAIRQPEQEESHE